MRLLDVSDAQGLREEDRQIAAQLCRVYRDKLKRNNLRTKYYEDKVDVKNLGLTVPPEFRNIDTSVGWAAKSVDMLAARSIMDGVTLESGKDEMLDLIMRENDIFNEYQKAVTSELTHSCGFWTVSAGGIGEPAAIINFHDAASSSALWDYRHRRIKAGMVIADMGYINGHEEPILVYIFTDDAVIEIENGANGWKASYQSNPMGRPMMEPMCYRPSYKRPFGKSRISRTVMGITDEMKRELVRTALHSELFSAPQKYILGADDSAFSKSKLQLYMDSIMLVSRDENGDLPQLGQFSQASIEPHIAAMDKLACRMASETCLPVAAFGITSNGYTSTDALRASSDDIILEAEALNRTNGKALRNVALMALAVANNCRIEDLSEDVLTLSIQWKNPAIPSIAAQTDAMVKQASVCSWLPETSVYWEELGYSDEQRMRINSERKSAEASAAFYNSMFGEVNGNQTGMVG